MYKEYQAVVNHQLTLSPESWNFKSNPTYRNILEHVSKGQALDYLDLSSKRVDLKDFIKLFNKNDLYGRPIKEGLGSEIGSASPTNARYLYHSLLIKDHYEKFETKNIVEIGGGYGGLCLFLKSMVECSYHIFDLPEVMKLQKEYLKVHKLDSKFLDFHSELPNEFYLISNYCYSEIRDKDIRRKYMDVIDRAAGGFMLWNGDAMKNDVSIDETFRDKKIEAHVEKPLTGKENLEIYWRA